MSSDLVWILVSIVLIVVGIWDLRQGFKARKIPDRARRLTDTFSPEFGIVRGLLAILGGSVVLVWFGYTCFQ